jgi:magnesium-transporting ATPase (P-type)
MAATSEERQNASDAPVDTAFMVRDPILGIFIWVVVIANAAFSFWREYRAEAAMVELHKLLPQYARVVRDGEEMKVPANELVPGDVLVLAEGDHIPAAKLLKSLTENQQLEPDW